MNRALLALLLVAGCATPQATPKPVELSPLGERPPESTPTLASEAPAATDPPDPAPPAGEAPKVDSPTWIEASATRDGKPDNRLGRVLEPVRERFGLEELTLRGALEAHYDGAEFYGQVQAHNVHGRFELTLELPDGSTRQLDLKHSWGRLPKNATRDDVETAVYEDLDQALVAWVFGDPAVQDLSDDPAGLAEVAESARLSLLDRLRRRSPRGRLAKAAHAWGELAR